MMPVKHPVEEMFDAIEEIPIVKLLAVVGVMILVLLAAEGVGAVFGSEDPKPRRRAKVIPFPVRHKTA